MAKRKRKSRAGQPLKLALKEPYLLVRDGWVLSDMATVRVVASTSTGRAVHISIRLDDSDLRCVIGQLRGAAKLMAERMHERAASIEAANNRAWPPTKEPTDG